MIEKALRGTYQTFFVDIIARKIRCSPYYMTLLAVLSGIFCAISIAGGQKGVAIILLCLSGFFDTLDGTVARLHNQTSPLGSVLDIVSDRFVEWLVLFGLYCYAPDRAILVILMLGTVLVCVSSFLVVGIFSENNSDKSFHYSPGIIERPEAFIFFILMIAQEQYFRPLALAFTTLVWLTTLIRLYQFAHSDHTLTSVNK